MLMSKGSSRVPGLPLRSLMPCLGLLTASLIITLASLHNPAHAVSAELKGSAPHHSDRKRPAANTALPIPPTPDLTKLEERLAQKGLARGNEVFLRIFKEESELELWMKQENRFVHFATYPICDWSGDLGPKLAEGDKQSPEGFYTISGGKPHQSGRWRRSFNLGFPNILDRSLLRTGSHLLIHGGCSSTGCYAMTDAIMAEIHDLVSSAIEAGQKLVPVHAFPFRMSAPNFARHAKHEWYNFWVNLKEGYDAFERTRLPPRISVCDGRYEFTDARAGEAATDAPLTPCPKTAAILEAEEKLRSLVRQPTLLKELPEEDRKLVALLPVPIEKIAAQQAAVRLRPRRSRGKPGAPKAITATTVAAPVGAPAIQCNLGLASCRRFLALRQRREKVGLIKAAKHNRGLTQSAKRK